MITEKLAAFARTIKARTVYAPTGQPIPSDHTLRHRSRWLEMANEFGLQVQQLEPRRDDFGFTTLDEAPAWIAQGEGSRHRVGLHIVEMKELVFSPSGIFQDKVTLGIIDPLSISHFLDRRPPWTDPKEWIRSHLSQDNVYDLTNIHPDNPVSRRLRADFRRKMIGYCLL